MKKLMRIEQLCKNQILEHVSFEIGQGEMVAIMGPSGSGKSTLLYQVAGMDTPSGGKIWLGDREISSLLEDEKAELTYKAKAFMEKLSIGGLEERSITQVSGGQLQRACICRSMMNEPEVLFADEPTGALNKAAATEVLEELVKLNREGTTILLVTHDSKVASRCHRILYLLDGRICGELTLDQYLQGGGKQPEEKVNRWLTDMGW